MHYFCSPRLLELTVARSFKIILHIYLARALGIQRNTYYTPEPVTCAKCFYTNIFFGILKIFGRPDSRGPHGYDATGFYCTYFDFLSMAKYFAISCTSL